MLTVIDNGIAVDLKMVSSLRQDAGGCVAIIEGKEINLGMKFADAYEMINRFKTEGIATTSTAQWAG